MPKMLQSLIIQHHHLMVTHIMALITTCHLMVLVIQNHPMVMTFTVDMADINREDIPRFIMLLDMVTEVMIHVIDCVKHDLVATNTFFNYLAKKSNLLIRKKHLFFTDYFLPHLTSTICNVVQSIIVDMSDCVFMAINGQLLS